MRYIKNDLFKRYDGSPFSLSDDERGVPEHNATIGEVLSVALRVYDENHNRFVRTGQLLSPTEIRSFNVLLDLLEGAKPGAFIPIENDDFKLLQKLVGWTLPTSPAWRDAPTLQELLDQAPRALNDHLSVPVASSTNGAKPAAALEPLLGPRKE